MLHLTSIQMNIFRASPVWQKMLSSAEISRLEIHQTLLDEANSLARPLWTMNHWRVKIDREKSLGMFVILDPMDPSHELYLTEAEYKALVTTSLRASTSLKVIARPDSAFSWEPLPSPEAIAEHNATLRQEGVPKAPLLSGDKLGQVGNVASPTNTTNKPNPSKPEGSPPGIFGLSGSVHKYATWRDALPLLKKGLLSKEAEHGITSSDLSLEDSVRLYQAWQKLLSEGPGLVKAKKGGTSSQLVWGKSWSKHSQDKVIHWALGSVFKWARNFSFKDNQLSTYVASSGRNKDDLWVSPRTDVTVRTGHKRNLVSALSLWGKLLLHWNKITPKSLMHNQALGQFALAFGVLLASSGPSFTIKYMKISLFALNSFLAGTRLEDTRALGLSVGMRNGLPSIIPRYWRGIIRVEARSSQDPSITRVVASLLNSYKAIQGPYPEPPFKTIMADPLPQEVKLPEVEAKRFWGSLQRRGIPLPGFSPAKYTPKFRTSGKAGPNGPSLHAAGIDALVWAALYSSSDTTPIHDFLASSRYWEKWNKVWLEVYSAACQELQERSSRYSHWGPWLRCSRKQNEVHLGLRPASPVESLPLGVFRPEIPNPETILPEVSLDGTPYLPELEDDRPPLLKRIIFPFLGKLALKHEPAGKVRVFALVDYWTQSIMSAFHDYFFDLLRVFPSDATFDQTGTLEKFVARGHKEFYCYDLTAATDMIPTPLYRCLMAPLLGEATTNAWLNLLTDRAFLFKGHASTDLELMNLSLVDSYRYTRGQPMGALSSWASLALVHHFLLGLAYAEIKDTLPVSFEYLDNYLVLGDDLVISNEKLAKSYLNICERYGIPIGLAKSFTSVHSFLNFANQSWLGTKNLSPLSLREEIAAVSSSGRREMVGRLVSRGWCGLGSLVSYKPGEALENVNRSREVVTLLRAALNPFQWASEMDYLRIGRISLPGLSTLRTILAPSSSRKTPWGTDYRLEDFELWIFATLASYGHLAMKSGFLSYLGQENSFGNLVPLETLKEIAVRVRHLPNSPERVLDYVADFDFDKARRTYLDPVFTQSMVPLYEAALSSLEHCPRPTDVDPDDEHDWFVFDDEAWSNYEMKKFISLKTELGMNNSSEEGALALQDSKFYLREIYNWIQIHLNLVTPHHADLIMYPVREPVNAVNLRERNLLMDLLSIHPAAPTISSEQTMVPDLGRTPTLPFGRDKENSFTHTPSPLGGWGVVENWDLRSDPSRVENLLAEAMGSEPFAALKPERTLAPEDDLQFQENLDKAFRFLDGLWYEDGSNPNDYLGKSSPSANVAKVPEGTPCEGLPRESVVPGSVPVPREIDPEVQRCQDPDWMSEPHFPPDFDKKKGLRKWSKDPWEDGL